MLYLTTIKHFLFSFEEIFYSAQYVRHQLFGCCRRKEYKVEVAIEEFWATFFDIICKASEIYKQIYLSLRPIHLYLIFEKSSSTNWIFNLQKSISKLIFVTSGVELLWGNCTVFPVPVQGTVTGGT